jgi:hypothetical protein
MRVRLSIAALAAFGLAGACATPFTARDHQPLCRGAGFSIDTDFPASGIHRCVIAPDGSAVISVDHEPAVAEGINPSPWFAFRLTSDAARAVIVTLDYTDYAHRYVPWLRFGGREWTQLPADHLVLNEKKTRATLTIDAPAGVSMVAGQPVSPSDDNIAWTANAVTGHGFERTVYGRSLDGRPLVGFSGGGASGSDAIVILTRQHPPETTGQDAYRAFVTELMTRGDERARAFRASHHIVLAPMPNPDGVDKGHWRLNDGGIDLNRDWGKFTQPETRALSGWILKQTAGRRTVAFMDFHSTFKSVIYAPPLDAPSPTIDFLPALEKAFEAKLQAPPEWSYAHNVNGGTSKGWALEALKAPGITVELWDQIPTSDAQALGRAAADAAIDYFSR